MFYIYHYTDGAGFGGILGNLHENTPIETCLTARWRFKANQPMKTVVKKKQKPGGVYFTAVKSSSTKALKKLGIPKKKLAYVFVINVESIITKLKKVSFSGEDYTVFLVGNGLGQKICIKCKDELVITDRNKKIWCGKTSECKL